MNSETFKYLGIVFAVVFIILIYLNFRKSWTLKRDLKRDGLVIEAKVVKVMMIHDSMFSESVSDQWNANSEKVRYEVEFKDQKGNIQKAILTGYKEKRALEIGNIINVKFSENISGFVRFTY